MNNTTNLVAYTCAACGDSSDNRNEARIHAKIHQNVRFEDLYPNAPIEAARSDVAQPVEKTK